MKPVLPRRGRITTPRLRARAFRGSILIGGRRIGVHVGVKNTLAVGMKRSEEENKMQFCCARPASGRFVLRVCKSKLPLLMRRGLVSPCCHRSFSSPGPDNFFAIAYVSVIPGGAVRCGACGRWDLKLEYVLNALRESRQCAGWSQPSASRRFIVCRSLLSLSLSLFFFWLSTLHVDCTK